MTCVLGIDPGSRTTGYALVDIDGPNARYRTCGCFRLGSDALPVRLGILFAGLQDVLAEHRPDEVSIERVFMHRNADSALKLGQARGAAIAAVVHAGLPVNEYAPTQIKQAIVGRGHAGKDQVQHMVKILLGIQDKLQADAADALAIAICHVHMRQGLQRLPGARGMARGRWL